MTAAIGEKIKTLRKSLKLTQSQLAGDEMTKSMLSQIENNLAYPSMKSLLYLADKLGKPIAFFLEQQYSDNSSNIATDNVISTPIEEIQQELKNINKLIDTNCYNDAKQKLNSLLNNYKFDKSSKTYADIIYKLGMCLGNLDELSESEEKLNEAIKVYEAGFLYLDAAKAYIELLNKPWIAQDYEEFSKILKKAHIIYKKSINKDEMFEIEYLYYKALLESTTGNINDTLITLDKAIKISMKTQMYYKSDELHRMYANSSLVLQRYNDYLYNIKKAQQFAQFTENKISLELIEFSLAIYENEMNNPNKALEHLKYSFEYIQEKKYLYFLEKAKSYYLLNRYEEAYKQIKQAQYSDNVYHTFDYLLLWSGRVYEGLIQHKLGNTEEGLKLIQYAISKMEIKAKSRFLAFAYKSLSELYSDCNDFELAFKALKHSSNIEDGLKGLPYLSK